MYYSVFIKILLPLRVYTKCFKLHYKVKLWKAWKEIDRICGKGCEHFTLGKVIHIKGSIQISGGGGDFHKGRLEI